VTLLRDARYSVLDDRYSTEAAVNGEVNLKAGRFLLFRAFRLTSFRRILDGVSASARKRSPSLHGSIVEIAIRDLRLARIDCSRDV